MDNYQEAIKKNAGYRNNAVLNKNVIRMLRAPRRARRRRTSCAATIGAPGRAYLRYAAQHAANPVVRKQAASARRAIIR